MLCFSISLRLRRSAFFSLCLLTTCSNAFDFTRAILSKALKVKVLNEDGQRRFAGLLLVICDLAELLWTFIERKSRMPQIRGDKGEAVVSYAESLATLEMGYHRLSQRVNKMKIEKKNDNSPTEDTKTPNLTPCMWLGF